MDFVQIYFKKFNEIAVISNFLAFFCFYLTFFNLLDPDPQPTPPPPQPACSCGARCALGPKHRISCANNSLSLSHSLSLSGCVLLTLFCHSRQNNRTAKTPHVARARDAEQLAAGVRWVRCAV